MRVRVGNYELWEELARGGMAIVYKGYQPTLNRVVAIKMLLPQLTRDEEFRTRFLNEAKVIALLNHPNIIRIHDIEWVADQIYIIMEYIGGPSLAGLLRSAGKLTPERTADLGLQIVQALAQAHADGIIHRDIKPDNLLLTPEGLLKVMDFGVAKISQSKFKTQAGIRLGTPEYMAPEQALGQPIDLRSDLYSLGIVLYELCTGTLPYSGRDSFEIALHHVKSPIPSPRKVVPDLPQQLEMIIVKALSKSRDHRYQSALEMAQALEHFATQSGVSALRPPPNSGLTDRTCPGCSQIVKDDYSACPACGSLLRQTCSGCFQPISIYSSGCPYCWNKPLKTEIFAKVEEPEGKRSFFDRGLSTLRRTKEEAKKLVAGRRRSPGRKEQPGAVGSGLTDSNLCPKCGQPVAEDFHRCPYCGNNLR